MSYLKINDIDFSMYVCELKINNTNNYNSQVNASGNTVVDYINSKRDFEVSIIPLDNNAMQKLMKEINKFKVKLSFLNPNTKALEENINCIIPSSNIEYFTIQSNRVSFKGFNLHFIEL